MNNVQPMHGRGGSAAVTVSKTVLENREKYLRNPKGWKRAEGTGLFNSVPVILT